MSEEAVKALALEWLQSTGVRATDVLTVRGAGHDWEGSTDEGYHSAFRVSIEFVADGRQRPVWVDVEGQQMSALWEFMLGRATEPAPFSIEAVVRARVGTHRVVLAVAADLPAQVPVVLDAGTRVRLAVLPPQDSDPAGSDTGVADSDRGDSSGTNLRPGGEPSPSRQGRAIV